MASKPEDEHAAANTEVGRKRLDRSRRNALGKALAVFGLGVPAVQAAARSTNEHGSSRGSETNVGPDKPSVNPSENPSWEGYDNPHLRVKDGWDDWGTVLNPNKLPIYHDRFDRLEYRDVTQFGRRGERSNENAPPHHWAMVIDARRCVGCQACVVACKSENNVALGVYRTWVDVFQTGDTVPDPQGDIVVGGQSYRQEVQLHAIPKLCNHCDNPPCVEVCPVKATFKRQDGIVLVDHRLCIGCGTCVNACPYNARYIDPVSHTADKCTFCVERVDAGLLPACVTTCTGRARIFGDLQDPNSPVSQLLAEHHFTRRHVEYGTDPQVYYIGMSGDIEHDPNRNVHHMVFTYTSNANNSVVKDAVDKV